MARWCSTSTWLAGSGSSPQAHSLRTGLDWGSQRSHKHELSFAMLSHTWPSKYKVNDKQMYLTWGCKSMGEFLMETAKIAASCSKMQHKFNGIPERLNGYTPFADKNNPLVESLEISWCCGSLQVWAWFQCWPPPTQKKAKQPLLLRMSDNQL